MRKPFAIALCFLFLFGTGLRLAQSAAAPAAAHLNAHVAQIDAAVDAATN